ncbi:DUF3152 domain-containing protein [Streptomyces harbinensis]|uniref:DUF3152 domain-containing protein n=1 Tax=Streptomyces harbinensis TaxID=1176198 RepID=UPI0037230521
MKSSVRRLRIGWFLGASAASAVILLALAGPSAQLLPHDPQGAKNGTGDPTVGVAAPRPGPEGGGSGTGERGADGAAEETAEESGPEEPAGYEELLTTVIDLDPELTGSGELVPVPGSDAAADPDAARVYRYRVDVEEDLPVDPEFFAEVVHRTLNDPRSWGSDGRRGFARISAGTPDFVITLASPGTTAEWCAKVGLDTWEDNVSCDVAYTERIMINAWRFARGSDTFGDDIAGYRHMVINHEVGHRLGHGHHTCTTEGALAPVMMQQTKTLTTPGSDVSCLPNPWPNPER